MISTPHKNHALPSGLEANASSMLSLGKLSDLPWSGDAADHARLKQRNL